MSPSEAMNAATRNEWRKLGFFYDYDEKRKEWQLVGSKAGLRQFLNLLLEYVKNPKHDRKSEHDHYGPYMYLEIMTWDAPGINDHCIQGTLSDLKGLAELVDKKLGVSKPGTSFVIRDEYAKSAEASLVFNVKTDDFDPASADPMLR
jgi:hypothetical protein